MGQVQVLVAAGDLRTPRWSGKIVDLMVFDVFGIQLTTILKGPEVVFGGIRGLKRNAFTHGHTPFSVASRFSAYRSTLLMRRVAIGEWQSVFDEFHCLHCLLKSSGIQHTGIAMNCPVCLSHIPPKRDSVRLRQRLRPSNACRRRCKRCGRCAVSLRGTDGART